MNKTINPPQRPPIFGLQGLPGALPAGSPLFVSPPDTIQLNLHARVVYGANDHHKAEALFKALGRALDMATKIDERIAGKLPSTKELL